MMDREAVTEGAMTAIEFQRDRVAPTTRPTGVGRAREVLLVCGIMSSVLYAAMLVVVPLRWDAYSSASQTVSELSAIGAPTRSLWVSLGMVYTVLAMAFGCGVWLSAGRRHLLRATGGVLIVQSLIGAFWPPMHLRGAEQTLTDIMHIAFASAWLLLMLLAMSFGAAARG